MVMPSPVRQTTPGGTSLRLAVLLCLAFAVPLLLPTLPPLSDLPAHVGRYHVMLSGNQVPALARGFAFRWQLVGNLGVDLLVWALAHVVGVELATKLIVLLIPPLTVAGMLSLAREVHGRVPPNSLFALPLAYGYPLHFGFLNFALALALALLAAALWIRLTRRQRPLLRAMIFSIIAPIVWVTHVAGWAAFGLIAFGIDFAFRRGTGVSMPRATVRAAAAMLPLIVPLVIMAAASPAGGGLGIGDWSITAKLDWIVSLVRDRWWWLDIATAGLIYAVIAFGLTSRRMKRSPLLLWPALLCGVAFVVLPSHLVGGSYTDMRMLPLTAALVLMSFDVRPEHMRLDVALRRAGLAFVTLRLVATTIGFLQFGAAIRTEAAALPFIPRGASVLVLVNRPCTRPWALSRLEHIGSLALVRRDAFVNDQWSVAGSHLIRIRQSDVAPFARDPSQYVYDRPCPKRAFMLFDEAIARFDRRGFDHVWTIGFARDRVQAPDLEPIWRSDRSTLYKVVGQRVR